jgi:hypothetical protein
LEARERRSRDFLEDRKIAPEPVIEASKQRARGLS